MTRPPVLGSIVIAAAAAAAAACTGAGSNVDLAKGDATDPVVVSRACRDAPRDPLHLAAVTIEGTLLRVQVAHGGGCTEHAFAACWDGLIRETAPPRTQLVLHHDANGDSCDARLSHDVLIDASSMAFDLGAAAIADPAGTLELVGR